MSERPARDALVAALRNRRRHLLAVATVHGSRVACYGAVLIAFVVWMAWFVLTAVDWLRRADF